MQAPLLGDQNDVQVLWHGCLLASWQRYEACLRSTKRKVRQLHASLVPLPEAIRDVRRCFRQEEVAREQYLLVLKSFPAEVSPANADGRGTANAAWPAPAERRPDAA